MSASNCSGPALVTHAQIFLFDISPSFHFCLSSLPSSCDFISLEIPNKALVHPALRAGAVLDPGVTQNTQGCGVLVVPAWDLPALGHFLFSTNSPSSELNFFG